MNSFVPSEMSEQIRVASWLDRHLIHWEHIPNEGRRTAVEARRLKMAGLKPGTADIHISSRVPKHPDVRGVRIEMKKLGGKATPLQLHRLRVLEAECGYLTQVCQGADEAIAWLMGLGFGV